MSQNDQTYNLRLTLSNSVGVEIILSSDNVISLSITESVLSILPKFEMIITDKGSLLEGFPITDKMSFGIMMDNGVDDEEPLIDANYIISTFHTKPNSTDNQHLIFTINGYQRVNKMFSPYTKEAFTGSSNEVLRQIASNVDMGFDNRVSGVEDNIWYQNGNNFQFITHIADRSFIDDDGVFVYGDRNGSLVYTSYKTEASREIRHVAVHSIDRVENNILLDSDIHMYYNSYNIVNNVEMYNNVVLYGGTYSYYNLEKYIYTDIDLNTKDTDRYNQHSSYKDNGVFSIGVGLIPDESLMETIYKGKIQNAFYKYAMFSVNIVLNINNSTKVDLFDKVDLNLQSTTTRDSIVEPYSGEYMVGSITYNITRDLILSKQVLLGRYGINVAQSQTVIEDII